MQASLQITTLRPRAVTFAVSFWAVAMQGSGNLTNLIRDHLVLSPEIANDLLDLRRFPIVVGFFQSLLKQTSFCFDFDTLTVELLESFLKSAPSRVVAFARPVTFARGTICAWPVAFTAFPIPFAISARPVAFSSLAISFASWPVGFTSFAITFAVASRSIGFAPFPIAVAVTADFARGFALLVVVGHDAADHGDQNRRDRGGGE